MEDTQQDDLIDDFWPWFGTWEQIIRTNLASIIEYNDILRREDIDLSDEDRRKCANSALRAAWHLKDSWMILGRCLRLMYGKEQINLEPVCLDDVFAHVRDFLESRGVTIEITAQDLPKVKGDLKWLESAILGYVTDLHCQSAPYKGNLTHTFSAEVTDSDLVQIRIHTKSHEESLFNPMGWWGSGMAKFVVEQFGGHLVLEGDHLEAEADLTLLPWENGETKSS